MAYAYWARGHLNNTGILFGSILPDNQFGATLKSAFNATNTTLNIARDYLIRQTNNEKHHRKTKKKAPLLLDTELP